MNLIVISIVRNEKKRFLTEWLENVQTYADFHIVLDDCSDDGTFEVLKEYQTNNENKVSVFQAFSESMFKKNELALRNTLWNHLKTCLPLKEFDNSWIMVVDSDEFYDKELVERKQELLNLPPDYDVIACKLCDMWNDEDLYRTDGYWSPYFHRMFRFKNEPFAYEIKEGLHHPSIPSYAVNSRNVFNSEIKCKHRSYETIDLKIEKYNFYTKNVTNEFDLKHANSIMEDAETRSLNNKLPKILIASLVRNREWILPNFLKCLENTDYPKELIEYQFIVNNSTDNSLALLVEFRRKQGLEKVSIWDRNFQDSERKDHTWDTKLLKQMAFMRNEHLGYAQALGDVDYLISIDSDILFPPQVVKHLVLSQREIISPVFWAGWSDKVNFNTQMKMPQVWEKGGYELSDNFIHSLKAKRGLFQVGGLGAFTAIHKSVWEAGVNYNRIENLPDNINGEDRDFCIRAKAYGFNLWASTYYDLIHVDNKEMLEDLKGNKV